MILVFTWIQWCWKWTQARLLVEKYWFTLLEMWQELRNIAQSWSELWLKLKNIIDKWELVWPEIVWEIMNEVINKQTNQKLILDWFVRNDWNKQSLEKIINDYKVVFFELSEKDAIDRLLWRMYNPNTWETFPSSVINDPKTWEKLIKRKDDNKESILKRIDEYMNNTLPTAIKQEEEWKVIRINANQSITDVWNEMIQKLNLK